MPLYRFCRPEDIPMIVQALNTCYDVHFPQRPAMTVAQFREEMGLISLWPSNTMVVLENNDPIAVIVGTKRPYGCWIAKLGVRSDHQRQGIGRYIVEALTRKLSIIGPRVISVDVPVDNEGARSFSSIWGLTRGGSTGHSPVIPRHSPPKICARSIPSSPMWRSVAMNPFIPFPSAGSAMPIRCSSMPGVSAVTPSGRRTISTAICCCITTTIMDLALDPHADPIRVGTALLQRAAVDVKEALHIDKVAAQDPVRAVLEQAGLTPRESHVHMGQHIIKRGG